MTEEEWIQQYVERSESTDWCFWLGVYDEAGVGRLPIAPDYFPEAMKLLSELGVAVLTIDRKDWDEIEPDAY